MEYIYSRPPPPHTIEKRKIYRGKIILTFPQETRLCVCCTTVFVLWELHSSEGNGYYIWDMVFLTSLKLCVALLEQIIVLQSSCLFVCINKLSSPGISCFHLQSRLSLRYSRLMMHILICQKQSEKPSLLHTKNAKYHCVLPLLHISLYIFL